MVKKIFSTLLWILVFITWSANAKAVFAQIFKMELANPTSTVSAGGTFQVKVLINTGGTESINGDALIIFDPAKVSIDSATTGNFFTYFSANPLAGVANKFLVSSWEESVAHGKTSTTDTLFSTLNLTAKTLGSTTLSFECTAGNEADTNINRASDSKDIVNCSGLLPLTFTIGAGGPTGTPSATTTPAYRPTSTPRPSATPSLTGIPVVSQLPRAGIMDNTFIALGLGVLLTVVGVVIIL